MEQLNAQRVIKSVENVTGERNVPLRRTYNKFLIQQAIEHHENDLRKIQEKLKTNPNNKLYKLQLIETLDTLIRLQSVDGVFSDIVSDTLTGLEGEQNDDELRELHDARTIYKIVTSTPAALPDQDSIEHSPDEHSPDDYSDPKKLKQQKSKDILASVNRKGEPGELSLEEEKLQSSSEFIPIDSLEGTGDGQRSAQPTPATVISTLRASNEEAEDRELELEARSEFIPIDSLEGTGDGQRSAQPTPATVRSTPSVRARRSGNIWQSPNPLESKGVSGPSDGHQSIDSLEGTGGGQQDANKSSRGNAKSRRISFTARNARSPAAVKERWRDPSPTGKAAEENEAYAQGRIGVDGRRRMGERRAGRRIGGRSSMGGRGAGRRFAGRSSMEGRGAGGDAAWEEGKQGDESAAAAAWEEGEQGDDSPAAAAWKEGEQETQHGRKGSRETIRRSRPQPHGRKGSR